MAEMAKHDKKEIESSSQRVLSAVVFVLGVLVLAAALQTYRQFTRGHGEVVMESEAESAAHSSQHARIRTGQSLLDPDQSDSHGHGEVVMESQAQSLRTPLITSQSLLTGNSRASSTQAAHTRARHASSPDVVADVLREAEEVREKIKFGYGSVLKAYNKLKTMVAGEPDDEQSCKPPRLRMLGKCVCPAGSKWDSDEGACLADSGTMFFYMYRAQSDHNYPMSNVDMADLAGVLYYLHHEIVKTNATPGVRMNGITRILRWLVTVRPSEQVSGQNLQFMPFVAFDSGRCSVPGCNRLWDHYGFAVGCQRAQDGHANYAYQSPNNPFGVWFSLPGACPELSVGEKASFRKQRFPGFVVDQ